MDALAVALMTRVSLAFPQSGHSAVSSCERIKISTVVSQVLQSYSYKGIAKVRLLGGSWWGEIQYNYCP